LDAVAGSGLALDHQGVHTLGNTALFETGTKNGMGIGSNGDRELWRGILVDGIEGFEETSSDRSR